MRKTLAFAAFALLFASSSFANYMVVLKNGTQYEAQAKWTIVNGKAQFRTKAGQLIAIDATLIDEAKSERATRLGLGGDAKELDLSPNLPSTGTSAKPAQSLGSAIRLRKPNEVQPQAETTATTTPPPPPAGSMLSDEVVQKFGRAYENVGIFEQTIKATGLHSMRAELTADSEDKVFNAISATSFLMVRNAGVPGVQVDMVELFMRTTTGGAAGRFQMSREDATALDTKAMSLQEYFVRKVLY